MASERHNFIVSAIGRKIRQAGFQILYLDGKFRDLRFGRFDIPPKIINHKPDIVAVKDDAFFCIGEAKTAHDIFSQRTKNQINDFISIVRMNPKNKLYVGIPLKSRADLERLLQELELHQDKQIEVILVPEELLPNEEL